MSNGEYKNPWDLAYELVSTWDGNKYSKADIDDMLFCEKQLTDEGIKCYAGHSEKGWVEVTISPDL